MNKTRQIGCLILMTLPIAATSAQVAEPPQVRKNYDNCVYFSVADQLKDRSIRDMGLVAENGFRACATEEQALTACRTFRRQ